MKKLFLFAILAAGSVLASAQDLIENFNVGPYIVDYYGDGDIRYKMRDDIDLYDFFELKKDTIVYNENEMRSLPTALQVSGKIGANRFSSKEIGIDGVWKKMIGNDLYFNAGLSLTSDLTDMGSKGLRRVLFEIGIPLQVELGKLSHDAASLYGNIGIVPTFYSTLKSTYWNGTNREKEDNKAGLLFTPVIEFGGNIPVKNLIIRIGFYGEYKINCTPGDNNVYKTGAGCAFLGAKLGVVF